MHTRHNTFNRAVIRDVLRGVCDDIKLSINIYIYTYIRVNYANCRNGIYIVHCIARGTSREGAGERKETDRCNIMCECERACV